MKVCEYSPWACTIKLFTIVIYELGGLYYKTFSVRKIEARGTKKCQSYNN
jgi:hypothetical protein